LPNDPGVATAVDLLAGQLLDFVGAMPAITEGTSRR